MALVAHRLRDHFQDRLLHLFVLKDDPYEPQREDTALPFVAVFRDEGFDHHRDDETVTRLSETINQDLGYAYVTTIYVTAAATYEQGVTRPIRAIREEGVAL